ncbi:GIY-YIG nuclease family protein [Kocuria sabuli]|uniref:GIY-YIG nuclease family protein n=1 Tax=Kocuria sabuli TaxID=3071448 RepID=UPI0034D4AED5
MNTAAATRLAPEAYLVEGPAAARLAFRFTPATVRALVPARICGTYLLLDGENPVYVGRSDACLRTRLASHNHRSSATHVLWEPARSPKNAYLLEAHWFHQHDLQLNQIHPASPAGQSLSCPFCDPLLIPALHYAFGHAA